MKVMKTFNPWVDMPRDIRNKFLENTVGISNDCYVRFCIEPEDYEELENGFEKHSYDPLTLWLMGQGCALGEEVLINHSW